MNMIIRLANDVDLKAVFDLRIEVFVKEQNVDPNIELDRHDFHAVHIIATQDDITIGCARLLFEEGMAHIGRLAVKKDYRGRGVGYAVCNFAIEHCKKLGYDYIWLNSQSYAMPFYEKLGFVPYGEKFYEAGIEHIKMVLD